MRPADSSEAAARRFAQLRAASRALATSLDYRVALDSVPATFVPALADWCTVKIFDSNGAVHLFVAHRDSNRLERLRAAALGASGRLGEGIIERLTHGEAVQLPAVRDALANASALDDAELDGTALLLGLVARGRMFGALTLGRLADAPWDAADIELVEEVARRAALQVDNARLYEEAINAARAREDFLATASHELRTPITSLQLELQLATRLVPVDDPHGVRSRLDAALRQTKRLTALVHELLDVSRLVAGHLELERHEVDLADLVRQVVDRFAAESTASGVPIFFHASSGATGQWDASRLDQVVTNLLANALGNPLIRGGAAEGLPAAESWGNPATLARHLADHGGDIGATSAEAYAQEASAFLQPAQIDGLPTKIDANGVIRVNDPAKNLFGAFNPNGTTRTLFSPSRGAAYWADQPGVAPWIPGGGQ